MRTYPLNFILIFIVSVLFAQVTEAQVLDWEKGVITTDSLRASMIVKHDSLNNVYTAGTSRYGAYISMLDSNGNLQWHTMVPRPAGILTGFLVSGLLVDHSGNSYLSGVFNSGLFPDSGFVMKVSHTGAVVWTYYSPASGVTAPAKSAILNMVLTGSDIALVTIASVSHVLDKVFVSSITQSSGSLNWSHEQGLVDAAVKSVGYTGFGYYIGCDDTGNIYVCALNSNPVPGGHAGVFAKYTASGSLKWQVQTPTATADTEDITSFYVDAKGNTFATGFTHTSIGLTPLITCVKSDGAVKYYQHYSYGIPGRPYITDVKADATGHAYITGWVFHSYSTGYTGAVAKADTNGNIMWLQRTQDTISAIYAQSFLLHDTILYVTGRGGSMSHSSYAGLVVARYNGHGALRWMKFWGYHNIYDVVTIATCIDLDKDNNLLIAGTTLDTSNDYVWTHPTFGYYYELYAARFKDTVAIFGPITPAAITRVPLVAEPLRLYPQPAAELLHVAMPGGNEINWRIYDMAGVKRAAGEALSVNDVFTISTAHLSSGSYIIQCSDDQNGNKQAAVFAIMK